MKANKDRIQASVIALQRGQRDETIWATLHELYARLFMNAVEKRLTGKNANSDPKIRKDVLLMVAEAMSMPDVVSAFRRFSDEQQKAKSIAPRGAKRKAKKHSNRQKPEK